MHSQPTKGYSYLNFFLYLLPVDVLTFTNLFFVLVLYLLPLPLILRFTQLFSQVCTRHFYHVLALGYDLPRPTVLI